MDSARVVHKPAPGIAAEQARDTRARAWAFVFRCWEEKQRAGVGPAHNARKGVKNDPDTTSISE